MVGGVLVIHHGLLAARRGEPGLHSADAEARARGERLAMAAVMAAELALGNEPQDVAADECGWDITSRTPDHDLRLVEVEGRALGASTVTVTRNEILTGFNQPDRYILALVEVGEHEAAEPMDRSAVASPVSQPDAAGSAPLAYAQRLHGFW